MSEFKVGERVSLAVTTESVPELYEPVVIMSIDDGVIRVRAVASIDNNEVSATFDAESGELLEPNSVEWDGRIEKYETAHNARYRSSFNYMLLLQVAEAFRHPLTDNELTTLGNINTDDLLKVYRQFIRGATFVLMTKMRNRTWDAMEDEADVGPDWKGRGWPWA